MTCRTPDLTVGLNLTEIEIERLRSKIIPILQDGDTDSLKDSDNTIDEDEKDEKDNSHEKDNNKDKIEHTTQEGDQKSEYKMTPNPNVQIEDAVTVRATGKHESETEPPIHTSTTEHKDDAVTERTRGKRESETEPPIYTSTERVCTTETIEKEPDSDDSFILSLDRALFNCTVLRIKTIRCSDGTVKTTQKYVRRQIPRCNLGNRRRQRRATEPAEPLNNNDLSFYIGFEFDGLSTYDNFTSLPVYEDPEYFQFEETDSVRMFSHRDVYLHIRGERMTLGINVKDLKVMIGAGICNITNLATNKLICKPPTEHPGHAEVEGPHNSVHVKVGIQIIANLI